MTAARAATAATPHRTPPRPVRPSRPGGRPGGGDGTAPHLHPLTPATGTGAPAATPRAAAPRAYTTATRAYLAVPAADTAAARDPYARLARGCRPRGCRAPARRVHGRRVRYVIGDEPGQVNGMRWRARTARPRR
ncbi:tryptophan biosynthesis modulator TrpM [Streptomyces sp. NPDC015131]|uniref:tryptophan biosynthesis modulator TrpM n=1 Tax=Streptomyces sp. NPDC015131 TaxID=3364941 RepID=UPI0037036651